MGIDTQLVLPPAAQVSDVANSIGIALGCPHQRKPLDRTSDAWYLSVDTVRVESIPGMPHCCYILATPPDADPQKLLYHFEWSRPAGHRGMLLHSWAKHIAVFRAVADVFGGTVHYTDFDPEPDYTAPPCDLVSADDGEPWQQWQERLESTHVVTKADIEAMIEHSAYDSRRI